MLRSIALVFAVVVCLSDSKAAASITDYDTRSDFDLAVGLTTLEDFNSLTPGVVPGPASIDLGPFSISNSSSINVTVFGGFFDIDGTLAVAAGTSSGIDTVFSFDSPINAFAIDTAQLNDRLLRTTVEADGASVPIGFVDSSVPSCGCRDVRSIRRD